MPVFNFNGIRGLSAKDRELWEKQNIKQLIEFGYDKWSEDDKRKAFRDASLTNKFGNRKDYSQIRALNDAQKDSLLMGKTNVKDVLKDVKIPLDRLDISKTDAIGSDALTVKKDALPGEETKRIDPKFKEAYNEWELKYKMSYQAYKKDIENIKSIAQKTSAHYKAYAGTDKLNDLTSDDWGQITKKYQAFLDTQGEEAANNYLEATLAEHVGDNTSGWENHRKGWAGLGASAFGSAVQALGTIYGKVNYYTKIGALWGDEYQKVEGLNAFENELNAMMDNGVFKYGADVVKYGSVFPESIKEAKEAGISKIAIESAGHNRGLIREMSDLLSEGLSQQGFTIVSMMLGMGSSKVLQWASGKMAAGIISTAKANNALMQSRKYLYLLQKGEQIGQKVLVPGLVGSLEGLSNGLETKLNTQEEGLKLLDKTHNNNVAEEAKRILDNDYTPVMSKNDEGVGIILYKNNKTGKLERAQDVYKSVWASKMNQFNTSAKQVEYAAAEAGLTDFYINSGINGLINATLKSTLQSDRVRKMLQIDRLLKPFQRFTSSFRVSGEGANITVNPRMGLAKKILNMFMEPIGEFIEEYLQNISSEGSKAAGLNNIKEFVNAKYSGNASVKVGDNFASDWTAFLSGAKDNLLSESSLRAGMMGALGSAMGIPTLGVHSASTGNFRTDSEGNLVLDKKGRPVEERTWLGRGRKANGERESVLDVAARLTPWRSPIINAYREANTEAEMMQARANQLQDWLRDPKNKAKWDGLVGTWEWQDRMMKAADVNDEFDYRNSHLGRLINDAFMLNDIKGTAVYDAQLQQLNNVANLKGSFDENGNLEQGDENTKEYIQSIRDNVNLDSDTKTDKEIFDQLKKNAQEQLQVLDNIQEASDEIESTFGKVNEDAKQALVYNRLADKDWAEREAQLEEAIKELQVTNSRDVESTKLNSEQKSLIAKHGSLAKAREAINKSNEKIIKLQEDIDNLKKLKNRSKVQERVLKSKQSKVEKLREQTKQDTKVLSSMPTISEEQTQADGTKVLKERAITDSDLVLNEQEIMSMSPYERAMFLLRGAAKRYNASHGIPQTEEQEKSPYNAEQQAVIDNLVNQIGDQGLADLVDLGRIQHAREQGAEVYARVASDREGLYQYINMQKAATARFLTRQKYAHLNDIKDYNQFREELDNVFKNGTLQERQTVRQMLKGNALWDKYAKQRQTVNEISRQLDSKGFTKDMNLNDMQLMDIISDYLVKNDIDLNDENAVVSALSRIEDNGNSALTNYVAKYNEGREKPITLDNISEVVGTYKKAIKQMNINQQAREHITNPAPATTGQSKPKPKSNLFDTASTDKNSGSGPTTIDIEENPTTEEPTELPPPPADMTIGDNGTIVTTPTDEEAEVDQLQDQANKFLDAHPDAQIADLQREFKIGYNRATRIWDAYGRTTPSRQESKTPATETPSQEFSPEARDRQTEEYKKAHKAEVLKRLRDKLAKDTGRFTRFLTNKRNTNLEKYDAFIQSLDENLSEEEILNAIEEQLKNNQEWDGTLKANLQSALNAVRDNMDDINNAVDKQLRDAERERKAQAETVTDDTVDRGIEFINPEEVLPGSSLAQLFLSTGSRKYIDEGRVQFRRKYKSGKKQVVKEEKPQVKFLFDPVIANQVKNEMGNRYSADALPIIAVYPLAQEEYSKFPNAIDINGKKYMPIGILPANNNTNAAGVATAKLIRDAVGDQTKKHFIKYNNKDIEATPRIKSPRLNSGNSKSQDRDVLNDANTVGQNAIAEAERRAQDNNQQLTQEEKDKIGVKAVKDFINKLHSRLKRIKRTVDGRTYFELAYQLPTLKGDNSVTNHLFREKALSDLTNSEGKDIMLMYNTGQSLENFNQFFTDFATHLEEIITEAIDKQIPFGSIDNARLNSQLNRDIYSTYDDYSIKPNDVGGFSLYLGDSQLASITLDDNNKPNIDYQVLFNNLIVPNGSLRENLNMQLDYEAMVNDDKRGHYLWDRAVTSGVLRNGIQDPNWERSNRTVTCEIPQGLGKPVPARRNPVVINDDSGNISGRNDDQASTPSGDIVDTQTGTDNKGNIPSNLTPNLFKQAMKIVDKIIEDTNSIHLTSNEENYEDGNHILYERVTQFIRETAKEFSKLWSTPSTNIGTTIDNFIRDFFELSNEKNGLTEESINELFVEHEDSDGKTYLKNSKNNRVYYNMTASQMKNLAKQVLQLQKYFKEQGLTVIPNDVTVTGVVNKDGQDHNIAGTLDILAVDKDGNFHIFDMKTHRWNYNDPSYDNKDITQLEYHKDKWGRQLSLYKKFIEDKYLQGTPHRVVECAIIPIKVDYAEPTEAKPFTSVDEANGTPRDNRINKLQYNGKNYNGATVSLDLNGEPDANGINQFEPISVRGDFYTNPEQAVGGPINPATPKRKSLLGDMEDQYQGSPDVDAGSGTQGTKQSWVSLTKEQRKNLAAKWGIKNAREAARKWQSMSAEQQKQELSCV